MKPIYDFLLTPLHNKRYDDVSRYGDHTLIINTSQEDHTTTNRFGVIKEVPFNYGGPIQRGDTVILHHNVFRISSDMKGVEQSSPCHFYENFYLVPPEQIYFYQNETPEIDNWKSTGDYCFIKPIQKVEKELLSLDKLEELIGEVTHDNSSLNNNGVSVGDYVSFLPDTEYEFRIGKEILYRIKNNRICVKMKLSD